MSFTGEFLNGFEAAKEDDKPTAQLEAEVAAAFAELRADREKKHAMHPPRRGPVPPPKLWNPWTRRRNAKGRDLAREIEEENREPRRRRK